MRDGVCFRRFSGFLSDSMGSRPSRDLVISSYFDKSKFFLLLESLILLIVDWKLIFEF